MSVSPNIITNHVNIYNLSEKKIGGSLSCVGGAVTGGKLKHSTQWDFWWWFTINRHASGHFKLAQNGWWILKNTKFKKNSTHLMEFLRIRLQHP